MLWYINIQLTISSKTSRHVDIQVWSNVEIGIFKKNIYLFIYLEDPVRTAQ